jgi:cytidylate kinase
MAYMMIIDTLSTLELKIEVQKFLIFTIINTKNMILDSQLNIYISNSYTNVYIYVYKYMYIYTNIYIG